MPFNKSTTIDHKKRIAGNSLYFISGFTCALFLLILSTLIGQQDCKKNIISKKYNFIASSIPCGDDKISSNYDLELKGKLQNYIDEATTRKITKHVSVYYYNFNDESWMGINENENFFPASLLKVPIVMAVMREAETTPDFLFQRVKYEGIETDLVQHYKPEEPLELGRIYTVAGLVDRAIRFSNNEATYALMEILGEEKISSVYHDIGVPFPGVNEVDFISVADYISFFKVLFNSQYLLQTSSEAVLSLLTNTTFKAGIVGGVPPSVKVAHKFGERIDEAKDGRQLHDCGIVYVPEKPYILCVMTRGNSFESLSEIIKNVSKIVYEDVSQ